MRDLRTAVRRPLRRADAPTPQASAQGSVAARASRDAIYLYSPPPTVTPAPPVAMPTLERPAARASGPTTHDPAPSALAPVDTFTQRHIGPNESEIASMLGAIGVESLEALVDRAVPASIRRREPLRLSGLEGVHGEFDTL